MQIMHYMTLYVRVSLATESYVDKMYMPHEHTSGTELLLNNSYKEKRAKRHLENDSQVSPTGQRDKQSRRYFIISASLITSLMMVIDHNYLGNEL